MSAGENRGIKKKQKRKENSLNEMKLIELKKEMGKILTIIVGSVNIPLSISIRTIGLKLSKDINELNNTNSLELINTYITFHISKQHIIFKWPQNIHQNTTPSGIK